MDAQQLAVEHEKSEFNTKVNQGWMNCKKSDGKKLWENIDWSGRSIKYETPKISASVIHPYFTTIFQSEKLNGSPTIEDVGNDLENYELYIPLLDDDITIEELNDAIRNIGTGISIDGISPEILKIMTPNMKFVILRLMNLVFKSTYPISWQKQLLFPVTKKGHTVKTPKLRGIAVGPALSRIYDSILDARFCQWFTPNKEQAGFRKKQGCLLQIMCVYLLMEFAKSKSKEMYVAFLDYEKAFDFLNRAELINKLMTRGVGKTFVNSVYNMYSSTGYIPRVTNSALDKEITTNYGVTQGKKSSANFYSFYVSDMESTCTNKSSQDFMYPTWLAQLADDTAIWSESFTSLETKLRYIYEYSENNYQHINSDKTKYLHLSPKPNSTPIVIDQKNTVKSVDDDGIYYLGMKMIRSNDIDDHVEKNLNEKMGNIHKFYTWLEINRTTPIKVKLLVLFNCALPAILYGAETWWNINKFEEKLALIERKAIKRCLGVKSGTPNDVVYSELNRPDLVSVIKDRQHKFFEKISELPEDEAIVKRICILCNNTNPIRYYQTLKNDHRTSSINDRITKMKNSDETLTKRYIEITNLEYSSVIYDSYMDEELRIILTRWRLSCTNLMIETGRYSGLLRNERVCSFCPNCIEDESHVLFVCQAYARLRIQFSDLITTNNTVPLLLNPRDPKTAVNTGRYLQLIERERKKLFKNNR